MAGTIDIETDDILLEKVETEEESLARRHEEAKLDGNYLDLTGDTDTDTDIDADELESDKDLDNAMLNVELKSVEAELINSNAKPKKNDSFNDPIETIRCTDKSYIWSKKYDDMKSNYIMNHIKQRILMKEQKEADDRWWKS
jgi:hypothetical protein